MEFDPRNDVIKLCVQGSALVEKGEFDEAAKVFQQAWDESANDLEKFLSAHFVALRQKDIANKLTWLETALRFALKINDEAVRPAFPTLYSDIAKCYEELGDHDNAKRNYELAASFTEEPSDKGPFYHGTKADLHTGDLLTPGGNSNYIDGVVMNHIYFTALVNGAGLAASLAKGDGRERVFRVEPTGAFENDPNVTNKKFPGNLTRSYRSTAPLKIVGEVTDWERQTPLERKEWRERLSKSGGEIIN